MKKENKDYYNEQFYDAQAQRSYESARKILRIVFETYRPKTMVDFGCGYGTWLSAARDMGVKKVVGFDGDWVSKEDLYSADIDFNVADLEKKIKVKDKFDMAISLEVAEHLRPESAEIFIKSICNASDVILFGAAIEDQNGTNHINTQWQSYWVDLFKKQGYQCYDIVRSQVWNSKNVEFWYKQNTFLFINNNSKELKKDIFDDKNYKMLQYNIVHPDHYKRKNLFITQHQKKISEYKRALSKHEREKSKQTIFCSLFLKMIKKIQQVKTFSINFIKTFF
jgi:2-polyprenyl-3-methyl-5-hydroxy-6-metoxy-1,4-benzoquinol methylase